MYAVIRDGSKQYRVEEGTVLDVDLRPANSGDTIEFSEVLLVGGEGDPRVGTPCLPEAKVLAEVQGEVKGKKVEVLHWRRRKSSRTHTGHRQRYTRVAIKKIVSGREESDGA
jgi:large subunit ribosomal protein L21